MNSIRQKVDIALKRLDRAIAEHNPIAVIGLFSGGHDSYSATFVASLHKRFQTAVHLNTGTGIARTRQFVYDECSRNACPLIEWCAKKNINAAGEPDPQDYESFVLKHGFPGKPGHGMMYSRLKERGLRFIERAFGASARKGTERRIMFISGCRSEESTRRMANTQEVQVEGRRIWVAPIHDWTKSDTSDLISEYNLNRNPVVDLIHRSGECNCGAMADGRRELDEMLLWPDTKQTALDLIAIESKVKAAGFPWGWGEEPPQWWLEKNRGQSFMFEYDRNEPTQHLCWSCNRKAAA